MPSIREYKISSVHKWSKHVLAMAPADDPSNIKYKFRVRPYSKKQPTIVWYDGVDKDGKVDSAHEGAEQSSRDIDEEKSIVVGTTKSDYVGQPIHLVVGRPEFNNSKEITMTYGKALTDATYYFTLPLNSSKGSGAGEASQPTVVNLRCKRTNDVQGWAHKMDSGMNLKLVDEADNRILARFIHVPKSSDPCGTLEIWEDLDVANWDLLATMALVAQSDQTLRTILLQAAA